MCIPKPINLSLDPRLGLILYTTDPDDITYFSKLFDTLEDALSILQLDFIYETFSSQRVTKVTRVLINIANSAILN